MTIIDHIIKLYEMSCEVLTPKSYQWKVVAQKMYEIAKDFNKEDNIRRKKMKDIWHKNNETPLDEARIIFITEEDGQTFGIFRDGSFIDFYHDITVPLSNIESWIYVDDLVKLSME